jgi:hypothetical protein
VFLWTTLSAILVSLHELYCVGLVDLDNRDVHEFRRVLKIRKDLIHSNISAMHFVMPKVIGRKHIFVYYQTNIMSLLF